MNFFPQCHSLFPHCNVCPFQRENGRKSWPPWHVSKQRPAHVEEISEVGEAQPTRSVLECVAARSLRKKHSLCRGLFNYWTIASIRREFNEECQQLLFCFLLFGSRRILLSFVLYNTTKWYWLAIRPVITNHCFIIKHTAQQNLEPHKSKCLPPPPPLPLHQNPCRPRLRRRQVQSLRQHQQRLRVLGVPKAKQSPNLPHPAKHINNHIFSYRIQQKTAAYRRVHFYIKHSMQNLSSSTANKSADATPTLTSSSLSSSSSESSWSLSWSSSWSDWASSSSTVRERKHCS